MKNTNLGYLLLLTLVWVTFVVPTAARADTVSLTAAITSYTGLALPGGVTFMSYCGADACSAPGGTPPPVLCPDLGCNDPNNLGDIVSNHPLGDPQHDRTSSVEFWALDSVHNDLSFKVAQGDHGPTFSVNPYQSFLLGTLSFTNGTWISNGKFGFEIQATDASSGTFHGVHTFTGFINMVVTAPPPGSNPADNADYLYLTDENGIALVDPVTNETLPSMRVYESFDAPSGTSNTGTVELWGQFGSLDLTGLQNPTGGAFIDPSLTDTPSVNPTPEPGSLALLGAGLALLWRTRKNARR